MSFLREASSAMTSQKFTEHGVVPDVISKAPDHLIEVKFSSGVSVNLGNVLTPTQVKDPPIHIKWPSEPGALYTLILTDPDAPSRKNPEFREWHHWLIVNVPEEHVSKGDVLSEYIGAGPPKDTGLHRYVFLVYKQPGKIQDAEHGHLTNRSAANRGKWSAAKFALKHKLGVPIAGNFYQVSFDSVLY
ncbi:unnamed protein product [Soboliphyme baturini]|uniref:Phosphatidylethanolamine-binding protein n=1 Tax=Soboliphyme baturini TaxID=241478 RepID=A0A183IT82_9BILA|nr:unnamed protein product [Soboliphyme baturini]